METRTIHSKVLIYTLLTVLAVLVVINHRETGTDSEYIGAGGCYGLGRVMALDEAACKGQDGGRDIPGKTGTGPRMTVLQW